MLRSTNSYVQLVRFKELSTQLTRKGSVQQILLRVLRATVDYRILVDRTMRLAHSRQADRKLAMRHAVVYEFLRTPSSRALLN